MTILPALFSFVRSSRGFCVSLIAGLIFTSISGLHAQNTEWFGTTGDWNTAENWSNGVPDSGLTVTIRNGGTAQLTTADGASVNLLIGDDSSLEISANGILTINGGFPNIIGGSATGTLSISGPAASVSIVNTNQLPLTPLVVGYFGGTGIVNLSDGGTLTLTQQGGSNTLWLGYGFSGTVGTLNIGTGGAAGILNASVVSSGTGSVAGLATVNFNHTDSDYYFTNDGTSAGTGIVIAGVNRVFQLGSGKTTLTAANTYTGGTTISAGTLQIGNGGTTGSITGNVTDNAALIFNRSDALTFGGVISGTGTLTNLGAGTTTLTGTNTYSGGTTISAGTLQIGNGGTTGSIVGDVTDNATLAFNRSDNLSFGGVISGTGGLTKLGAGTLTLNGTAANTYTGLTSVLAGKLVISTVNHLSAFAGDLSIGNSVSPGAAGSVVADFLHINQNAATSNLTIYEDGLLQVESSVNFNNVTMTGGKIDVASNAFSLGGSFSVNASAAGSQIISTNSFANLEFFRRSQIFTVADGTATYDLDIQAGISLGTLVKEGAGTVRLATTIANPFFSVTLNAGTIAVATDTALGSTTLGTGTFVLNGGTVVADGGDRTIANPISLTGDATIGASLDGTPRAITFTGTTTLTGDRTLTITNDAATTFGAIDLGANNLFVSGSGNETFNGTISGTGGLLKNTQGVLTLSGTNSYAGGTSLAGTISISNNVNLGAAFGTLSFAGGTLRTTADVTMNRATALAPFFGGTFDVASGTTLTQGGVMGGVGGGITKIGAGKLSLTGANTYTGRTTITAGTLQIGNGGTTGSIVGDITDNSALAFNRSNNLSYTGVITGGGTLTKLGAGTLTLSGDSDFTGGTSLQAGTLAIGHDNALGTGKLTIGGGTTLASVDVLRTISNNIVANGDFTIFPNAAGIGTSRFILSGGLDLNGATRTITNPSAVFGNVELDGVISNGGIKFATVAGNPGAAFQLGGTQANIYTGDTEVGTAVVLQLQKTAGVTAIAGDLVIDDGTGGVVVSNNEQIADTSKVTIHGAGLLLLGTLGAVTETIGSLYGDGGVVLDAAGSQLAVGSGDFSGAISGGKAGTIALQKYGSGTFTLSGSNPYVGDTLVEGGEMDVTGTVSNSINVYIGYSASDVSLLISDGGSVADTSASIGVSTSAQNNTVTVTGSGSSFTSTGTLNVGFDGSESTLLIENSGSVSANGLWIGGGAHSTENQVKVIGAGASIVTTNDVIIGYGGTNNSLSVTGGATVSNVHAFFGLLAGSDGNSATVSDAHSVWTNTGTFYLGDLGKNNTLTVSAGGKVTVALDALLGTASASTGNKLTVTGTGSEFVDKSTLYIGRSSSSNLMEILSGGLVTTKNSRIGGDATARDNTVNVDGAGSHWDNQGTLRIGSFGSINMLSIQNGGTVTAGGNTFLGYDAASAGNTLAIDGAGSAFNGGLIKVGENGGGIVSVTNGGTLTASSMVVLGANADSSGDLQIGQFGPAGTINTDEIFGGAGTALVNFVHTGSLTFAPRLTGSISLSQVAEGTTILTGLSTYTGATYVLGGELVVNGSLGNTSVTVADGATLGGTGSIGGLVEIQGGGILSPGNSPGTLTLDGLLLDSVSNSNFELDTPDIVGGGVNDLVSVTNNLYLNGLLNLTTGANFGTGTYRLFNYGGSLANYGLTIGTAPAGYNLTIDTTTANQVNLVTNYDGLQFWDGANTTSDGTVHGGDGTWDATITNWTNQSGSANSAWAGLTAVFSGTAGTVSVVSDVQVAGMQFATTGYTLEDDGGSLGITDASTEVRIDPATLATINAKITGAGGLLKTGAGELVLGGTNDYTGGTTINTGTLTAKNDAALGTGDTMIAPGATLSVDTGNLAVGALSGAGAITLNALGRNGGGITMTVGTGLTSTFYGNITGTSRGSQVTKTGAGTQVLGGINTFTGQFTINDGEVKLTSPFALSKNVDVWTMNTGTLRIDHVDATVGFIRGSEGSVIIDGGSLTLAGSLADFSYDGVISGRGDLVMNSSTLTQTLNRVNTYTGRTRVENGTLRAGVDGGFVNNTTYIVDGGFLDLNGHNLTASRFSGTGGEVTLGSARLTVNQTDNTQYAGLISGAGSLVKQGVGVLTLAANNTYMGGTTITAGTLQTSAATALGTGPVTLGANGTLAMTTSLTTGDFHWNGGTLAFDPTAASLTSNILTMGANGHFDLSGITANTKYDLLTYETAGSTLDDFLAAPLGGVPGTFTLVDNGDGTTTVVIDYIGSSSGKNLSNGAPTYTPTDADFIVNGQVQTSNATNTVNSLIFNNGAFLKVFNSLFVTSGDFNVPIGTATINGDGTVITPHGFTKLGAGLLNLLGNLNVNGDATIASGKLAVNGTLTAQDVIVQLDAWLKGSGLIFGNVFNNGMTAPGNSPGTLTISGNYTQSKTGTLQLEVASNSVFDQLIVGGNAALNGMLQVVSYHGFKFQYGQQFNFLHAKSISGKFSAITMPNPETLRGRFITNGGSGTLVVAPTSYTLVAQNQNQVNVAKALNHYIPAQSGDKKAVSTALDLQNASQYPNAFNAISPSFYESLAITSTEQAVTQSQMIAQRLSAVRLGIQGFNAQGIDMPLTSDKDGKSVMDAKDKKNVITPAGQTKWGLWVQGSGVFAKVSNVSDMPNYHYASGSFVGGADYRWNEGFTTGLYAGYQGSDSKYANGGSTITNSTLFGLYATYQKKGFYSDAIVGGSYNDYNVHRPIEFSTINRTARSDVNGGQLTSYLDFGYDWQVKGFTFSPLVSGQYTYTGLGSFNETGADSLDLRVNQQNANSLRTNLGGRVAFTWNMAKGIVIVPEVRLFWQHEYLENSRTVGASLDGGSGPGFDFTTSVPGRDSVFAGAGVSAQFGPNWNAYLYYNADFGRQDFTSQMISGGLGVKF